MAKYSDKTTRWEHLLSSLSVNAQDLLSLTEAERTELEHLLSRAKQLEAQQDVLRAQSSEVSRERKEVDLKGEELRRRLDTIIRGKYGSTSNKLKEFGLMPRRSPRRKPESEGQPVPAPAPSSVTHDPT
jgi:chromosome segregation ATPase